ncbi:hypothetical protein E4U17_001771 [Claviceps sp. LM77 group G4]|nr:hypothetical protein E4U17_001771 [Claviceps sp. LM77 group G4]KAG6074346.1 hypothetical protein E4U33_002540 [Claviceps sp. LM78 group G4]KAG6076302.1 hypothetical protein E4U16_002871 [Claviceps sp. LM84 group G4]
MAYEFLGLSQQSDRSLYADLDSGLGRNPSALPTHLSRVLYIPEHSTLNLSLYDARESFQQAVYVSPFGSEHLVGRPLIGSRFFKTRVNTMDREKIMQSGAPHYVVELDSECDRIEGGVDISATMRAHASVSDAVDSTTKINIQVPMSTDGFSLTLEHSKQIYDQIQHIAISATYPLQSVHSKAGIIRFPFFAFSLDENSMSYEWQIHPLDHGMLRYTLFRLPSHSPASGGNVAPPPREYPDAETIAIYHHLGHENSLFRPTSEGVLLLPGPEMSALLEMVTVASLLVLLWRIRSTAREGLGKEPQPKKRSLAEKLFGARKS